jgi:hypothetical protein
MVLLQARGLRPQFFLSAAALGKAEGAEGAKGGQAWKVPQDVRDVLEVGGVALCTAAWLGLFACIVWEG